jgi:NAD(P)H dehydrogenase (quinone)
MSSKSMLILYHSGSGNTQRMADLLAETMKSNKIDAVLRKVEEFEVRTLPEYDALVLGSPTYFSNVSWQVKKFIDESIMHYNGGKLKEKLAGIFTSAGTERDGKDCLKMLEVALGFHHGMKVIGGIIRVDGESGENVEKRCRDYGKRLAKELEKE